MVTLVQQPEGSLQEQNTAKVTTTPRHPNYAKAPELNNTKAAKSSNNTKAAQSSNNSAKATRAQSLGRGPRHHLQERNAGKATAAEIVPDV